MTPAVFLWLALPPGQSVGQDLADLRARLAIIEARAAVLRPAPAVLPAWRAAGPAGCGDPACACGCRQGLPCRCLVESVRLVPLAVAPPVPAMPGPVPAYRPAVVVPAVPPVLVPVAPVMPRAAVRLTPAAPC